MEQLGLNSSAGFSLAPSSHSVVECAATFEDLAGCERLGRPVNEHLPIGNHGVDEGSATPGRGSPIPMLAIPGEPVRAAGDGPCQDDGMLRLVGKAEVIPRVQRRA